VNTNRKWYDVLNDTPGCVRAPIERPIWEIRQYCKDWLGQDGHPFWPFWENVGSWWGIWDLPNVRLVHYSDLKRDMPGEIRVIAEFLEIPINESNWDTIREYCSFD
jgi:aryl sulfotransferase